MSTPASQLATPFQEPTSGATEIQALRFLMLQRLLKVQTVTVVRVVAVDPGAVGPVGTVDVLPLVGQVDGAGNVIPHQTIYSRPYVRLQGGVNAVIIDPAVGDLGVCMFCSRDISAVISSKAPSPPSSKRLFDYADGIYMGGVLNGTPQNYVQFEPGGTIKVVSTVAIDLQAPTVNITTTGNVDINGAIISSAGEVTDALGKVLGTHIHSGVQPGGGDSGPPV
jgi:GpV-like protein with Apex motif